MTDDLVKRFPAAGFARGAIVRKYGDGPNMLVVRQLDRTTIVVVIEGDDGGNLRLREIPSDNLEQVSSDAATRDGEFDLRWKADLRAIHKWRDANPGNDLVMPDHCDLVIWLLERDAKAAARITALEAENARMKAIASPTTFTELDDGLDLSDEEDEKILCASTVFEIDGKSWAADTILGYEKAAEIFNTILAAKVRRAAAAMEG